MSETKHIYIVDDDDSMRATLLRAFEKTDYQIHTFENAQLFLMAKVEHFPAVMLLDMNMPGLKGIDLQAALINNKWDIPIIFISGDTERKEIIQGLKNGAHDFLLKPFPLADVLKAVETAFQSIAKDEQYLSKRREAVKSYDFLTEREKEVFHLLAQGQMSKDVAVAMGITPATVKIFKANIFRKFQIEADAELVKLALEYRLLEI